MVSVNTCIPTRGKVQYRGENITDCCIQSFSTDNLTVYKGSVYNGSEYLDSYEATDPEPVRNWIRDILNHRR